MSKYLINLLELRRTNTLFLIIFVINIHILPDQIYAKNSESKFKIVFVADVRVAANQEWLKRVATDWGATGICLRVFWGHVDTDSVPEADNWENLDKAIKTITENHFNNKKLDIYLRVCMGLQKPNWVSPTNFRFVRDDFQIKYDNTIYNHQDYEKGIPDSEKHPLNFNSPNSQKYMRLFLSEVLTHIDKNFSDTVKSRIKEIVPTFSTSDEEEYPFAAMCGYSSYENEEFINYLKNKYSNSLSSLNERWNPENEFKDFISWSEIAPGTFNWHTYENSDYKYPNGRVDWINFRTEQLTSFINSLSDIISDFGFEMGVQVGSIYDDLMERRGWVDPTRLFEKANSIHVADIYQFSGNFDFGAEYLKSICKFWTLTNNMVSSLVRFSTETNWPNFNSKDPFFLSIHWKEQLESYYNEGASEHYIVGWDITPEELDRLKSLYQPWRSTLVGYSNREAVTKESNVAVHLGVEQVFYNHNTKSFWNNTFKLNDFITSQYNSIPKLEIFNGKKDIITNYMIEKNPNFLVNYDEIFFAKDNGYITEKAYLVLTDYLVNRTLINSSLEELDDAKELSARYKNENNQEFQILPTIIRLQNK